MIDQKYPPDRPNRTYVAPPKPIIPDPLRERLTEASVDALIRNVKRKHPDDPKQD